MSDPKDTLALSSAPEEKLLSPEEKPIELSSLEPKLEISPPQEHLSIEPPIQPYRLESGIMSSEVNSSETVATDLNNTQIPEGTQKSTSIFDTVGVDMPESSSENPRSETVSAADLPPVVPISIMGQEVVLSPHIPPQALSHMPDTTHEQKGTSYTVLLSIGIFLLSLVGAGIFWYTSSPGDQNNMIINTTPEIVSAEQKTLPSYEEMIAENIERSEEDIELINRAISEGDISLCDAIMEQSRKTECRESLLAQSISSSGSVQDCETLTLSDIRDNCTTAVIQSDAIQSLDRSLCTKIPDASQASYCTNSIEEKLLTEIIRTNTASSESCETLSGTYRAQCMDSVQRTDDNALLQKSITDENLDTCKSLSTDELQTTCYDTIVLKQALKASDKTLCESLRDQGKKTTCLSYIEKQDDNANFKSAIVDKDISLCAKIATESLKNRCYDSVTLLIVRDTKNPSLCDTLLATGSIDSCKKSTQVQ